MPRRGDACIARGRGKPRPCKTPTFPSIVLPRASLRAVVATFQDLSFTIDQADLGLGIVTGTRLLERWEGSSMRMTVIVMPKADDRVSVRANARIGEKSVTQAETYQDFFVVLDKAMFLTRNNVD